jgi:hypothetical protein
VANDVHVCPIHRRFHCPEALADSTTPASKLCSIVCSFHRLLTFLSAASVELAAIGLAGLEQTGIARASSSCRSTSFAIPDAAAAVCDGGGRRGELRAPDASEPQGPPPTPLCKTRCPGITESDVSHFPFVNMHSQPPFASRLDSDGSGPARRYSPGTFCTVAAAAVAAAAVHTRVFEWALVGGRRLLPRVRSLNCERLFALGCTCGCERLASERASERVDLSGKQPMRVSAV